MTPLRGALRRRREHPNRSRRDGALPTWSCKKSCKTTVSRIPAARGQRGKTLRDRGSRHDYPPLRSVPRGPRAPNGSAPGSGLGSWIGPGTTPSAYPIAGMLKHAGCPRADPRRRCRPERRRSSSSGNTRRVKRLIGMLSLLVLAGALAMLAPAAALATSAGDQQYVDPLGGSSSGSGSGSSQSGSSNPGSSSSGSSSAASSGSSSGSAVASSTPITTASSPTTTAPAPPRPPPLPPSRSPGMRAG